MIPQGTGIDGLSRLADDLVEALSSGLGAVLASEDPDAVHDLRVATRRLQQMLAALSPAPRPKRVDRLRKALRRVRRTLGSWRNCDVTLEAIAARARATRSPRRRAVWKLVATYLEQRRLEERIRARRALLVKESHGLTDRLRGVLVELSAAAAANGARESVHARGEAAWVQWQDAYRRAHQQRDIASVHALRIATKRLRYRLELARALGETTAEPVLEWARRVQQLLGNWHDHQMLQRLMAEALARPSVLLGELETVTAGVGELAREQAGAPANDPAVLSQVSIEDGDCAIGAWLARDKPTISH